MLELKVIIGFKVVYFVLIVLLKFQSVYSELFVVSPFEL